MQTSGVPLVNLKQPSPSRNPAAYARSSSVCFTPVRSDFVLSSERDLEIESLTSRSDGLHSNLPCLFRNRFVNTELNLVVDMGDLVNHPIMKSEVG